MNDQTKQEWWFPTDESLPEFEGKRGKQRGSTGLMLENYIAKLLAEGHEDAAAVAGTIYAGLIETNYTRKPAYSDLRPEDKPEEENVSQETPDEPETEREVSQETPAGLRIYTFGTQKRKLANLAHLVGEHDAVVVDVRHRAGSRVREWNKGAMKRTLGDRYRHVRGFGNLNYKKRGAPIELADPEAGLAEVREVLASGKSVILLCYEEDPADCHRTTAAQLIASATGLEVTHLLRDGFTSRLI